MQDTKQKAPVSCYKLGNKMYLNITNRCTNRCSFCIRRGAQGVAGYNLWLKEEPTVDEVLDCVGDPRDYEEIVFCGFGEPLLRIEEVIEICRRLKASGDVPIRVDTNGHANMVHGHNVLPKLQGLVDTISISLNAQDAETYSHLCRPDYGEEAYQAVISFAREAVKYIPKVILSVVNVPGVDIKECERITREIGADFRVREFLEKL